MMTKEAREHELDADEGYRWKRILRRAQRCPAVHYSVTDPSAVAPRPAAARFARVLALLQQAG